MFAAAAALHAGPMLASSLRPTSAARIVFASPASAPAMLLDHGLLPEMAVTPLSGGLDLDILSLMTLTSLFGATCGFGDGIIAIPLLALLCGIDVTQAAPLQTVVSSCLGVCILLVDAWTEARAAAAGVGGERIGRYGESLLLFATAALGVPAGVQTLVSVDPGLIRAVVGAVLVAYGVWAILQSADGEAAPAGGSPTAVPAAESSIAAPAPWDWPLRSIPYGLVAGALCGAVGEPGPVAILYGQQQRWSPVVLRGMLARFFLPVQLVTLREFAAQGLLTDGILEQSLYSLPSVVLAVLIGTRLNRALDPDKFTTAVDGLVVGLGGVCLYSGVVAEL